MWHYTQNGETEGPLSEAALLTLIQNGQITQDTLVWKEGLESWLAISTIDAFKNSLPIIVQTTKSPVMRRSVPTNLKPCKTCGNGVSKSAKVCPHCGAKLRMGMFSKLLLGSLMLGFGLPFISGINNYLSSSGMSDGQNTTFVSIENASPSSLQPKGKMYDVFTIGTSYTAIQRANYEKKIAGSVVQWKLPVYDVERSRSGVYLISSIGAGYVSANIHLTARNDAESRYIESLKSGDMLSFKGRIKKVEGIISRALVIEDAILLRRAKAERK